MIKMEVRLDKLLSKDRLDSYQSIEQHFDNLKLIGKIAPSLLLIEICLRNSIDNELGSKKNNWLYNSKEPFIYESINEENKKAKQRLNHHQLISKFNFKFWLVVLDKLRPISIFVDTNKICLKDYHNGNSEVVNNHRISDYTKMKIIFSLVHKIRNRAFHAENLSKLDKYNKPVIWVRFGQGIFRVDSDKIERLLNDVLGLFGIKDLI